MSLAFDGVDRLMQAAVDQSVFPGAVLWVARDGRCVIHKAYGWADLFRPRPMTVDTVFDLASLTKPLATALAVMHLVQQEAVDLDQSLCEFWTRLPAEKKSITIRKLLSHTSGLAAWRAYFMQLRHLPFDQRLARLRQWLLAEPLASDPDPKGLYSDLGYLMLQWVIEDVTAMRLDHLVTHAIYGPMAIRDLFFIDLLQPPPPVPFAATELCPWRNRLLVGEVHDDNAHVLGGVAGHAGLFGTAAAVGQLIELLRLAENSPDQGAPLSGRLVAHFFHRQPNSTWGLGFDTPATVGSSAGHLFSSGSVGHLGYTGTSFWMDRQRGIIVVLLTNRVHPSRHNQRLKKLRPKLHDEVMAALIKNQD